MSIKTRYDWKGFLITSIISIPLSLIIYSKFSDKNSFNMEGLIITEFLGIFILFILMVLITELLRLKSKNR